MTNSESFPSGLEIVRRIGDGETTVAAVAAEAQEQVARLDGELQSFVRSDQDALKEEVRRLQAERATGPLHGLPVAVKDLIDTRCQATEYGSPIYRGNRPAEDAEVVRRLRGAGAFVLGKTVTTEFAFFQPPLTRNPHDPERTPGGSSSGSAAAVAAGLVPVALGTQTAGSVIRPASYCGVVGFKPTFGALDTAGVKPLSPSLDTLGILGRDLEDVAAVFDCLRSVGPTARATQGIVVVGVCRTPRWDSLSPDARAAFDTVLSTLDAVPGVELLDLGPLLQLEEIAAAQTVIMEFEAARTLATEFREHREQLSDVLSAFLERAQLRTQAEADAAAELVAAHRATLRELFGAAHVLATPAAAGEAPLRDTTGDPWFCRAWTVLHTPAISLPVMHGAAGLPIGLQLVGRPGHDDELLACAARLGSVLASDTRKTRNRV